MDGSQVRIGNTNQCEETMSTNRTLCAAFRAVLQRRTNDQLAGIIDSPKGTFRDEIIEAINAR
jgi:hypothetical protein